MTRDIGRRALLRTGAVVAAGLLAGCSGDGGSGGGDGGDGDGGTATPTGTPTPTDAPMEAETDTAADGASGGDFDGWLSDVDNYDGVVDGTGASEATVVVGAEGNGGAFAFEPAAVRVDAGTTVVWEWNGEGGQHNVLAEEGADFASELTDEAGHTFAWTPESGTTATYYCQPHLSLGMKGVVVVE